VLTNNYTLRLAANEKAREEGRRKPPTPLSGRPSWRNYYPTCPECEGKGRIPVLVYTLRIERTDRNDILYSGTVDQLPDAHVTGADPDGVLAALVTEIQLLDHREPAEPYPPVPPAT
jgi:hypothetical protein